SGGVFSAVCPSWKAPRPGSGDGPPRGRSRRAWDEGGVGRRGWVARSVLLRKPKERRRLAMVRFYRLSALAILGFLGACGGTDGTKPDGGVGDPDRFSEPGSQVTLSLSAEGQEAKRALDDLLEAVSSLDASGFAARTRVDFEELNYD